MSTLQLCASLGPVGATGSPIYERFALPTLEPEAEFFKQWARGVPLSLVLVYAAAGGRVTYPPFACGPYDSTSTPVAGSCTDQVWLLLATACRVSVWRGAGSVHKYVLALAEYGPGAPDRPIAR